MVKTPTEGPALDALTVPERILLFCVASGTGPPKTKITKRTIERLVIKALSSTSPIGPH
jgi:hypothetical protein